MVKVSASDSVDCALEGAKTKCIVNTYKLSSLDPRVLALPKLVAVYAHAKVRGRHIGIVCSFYQDDAPSLCNAVLDLAQGFDPFLLQAPHN